MLPYPCSTVTPRLVDAVGGTVVPTRVVVIADHVRVLVALARHAAVVRPGHEPGLVARLEGTRHCLVGRFALVIVRLPLVEKAPTRKRYAFFEFSLRLSRACLGKMMRFT